MKKSEIFEKAKAFDLAEYVQQYGIELKKSGNSQCPFCNHHNFSVKRSQNFFKCFSSSCDKAGDIITFCQLINGIDNPLEAAKKVLADHGVFVEDFENKYDNELTKKRIERQREQQQILEQKEEQERKKASVEMGKIYETLLYNAKKPEHEAKIRDVFPNYKAGYFKLYDETIGFCEANDSVVIVNRDDEIVYNIKYRTKKDKKGKVREGKWISTFKATQYPFPMSFFSKNNNSVFICEGEKDAINLRLIGVNVLTLGGVTLSWQKHKELLRGKNVYIFFDHDEAGYIGALKRFDEIWHVAQNVYFVLFFYLKGSQCPKGYDVSDWLFEQKIFITENTIDEKELAFNRFLKAIKYSTFKATSATLSLIASWLNLDSEDRKKYGIPSKKNIKEVFWSWNQFVEKPKFDMEDVEPVLKQIQERHRTHTKPEMQNVLLNATDELRKYIKDLLSVKQTLLSSYCKMGRNDVWMAFLEMTKKSGSVIAKDSRGLLVWDGRSFTRMEDEVFLRYCMQQWFERARVQKRSHHKDTAQFLLNDITAHADNVDEIKKSQSDRAYSMKNGTFFVTQFGNSYFVEEHKKEYFCLNYLDFYYDVNADCPKWQSMIERVLPNEQERMALQEFFGYCLYPKHDYETFLFLFGESGANGKSVVLDVLSSFFGEDNVSHLQMQNLKGHELHALKNKVLNIGSEVDASSAIEGVQNLKVLVSARDLLEVNPKNKDNYVLGKSLQPKMAFSGNKKPTGGIDNGIFRRMLMIRFDEKITDTEKIYNMSERFVDEMDGIFNWAIIGLNRLIRNRKFTRSEKMIKDIEDYKDEQNPMRVFVREQIEVDKENAVDKVALYKAYESWAKSRGNQPLSNTRFFSAFKQECLHSRIQIEEIKPYQSKRQIKGIILTTSMEAMFGKEQQE